MNALHDTQRLFAGFVLGYGEHTPLSCGIKENGMTPEQRLAIYRNNTRLGLTEALRDGYPVVNKLVGADFFDLLAGDYIRHYPPTSGTLLSFGGRLADFIGAFQAVKSLPYLADTARLEWLWHEAFHETDDRGLDASLLAKVDPGLYGQLSFILQPNARFLSSEYPLLAIWRLNQENSPADARISLDQGGCRLLIFRAGLEVRIIPLNEPEYLLLTSLASGLTLTQAVNQSRGNDADFDLAASLQCWFTAGLITDFFIT